MQLHHPVSYGTEGCHIRDFIGPMMNHMGDWSSLSVCIQFEGEGQAGRGDIRSTDLCGSEPLNLTGRDSACVPPLLVQSLENEVDTLCVLLANLSRMHLVRMLVVLEQVSFGAVS